MFVVSLLNSENFESNLSVHQEEWLSKLCWYLHAMGYEAAIKKNEGGSHE